MDRFLSGDLLIHRWDLARATGQDAQLDPDEVRQQYRVALGFSEALRTPGAFGPALDPPPGADEQTQLLAFRGRRAW